MAPRTLADTIVSLKQLLKQQKGCREIWEIDVPAKDALVTLHFLCDLLMIISGDKYSESLGTMEAILELQDDNDELWRHVDKASIALHRLHHECRAFLRTIKRETQKHFEETE